MKKTIKVVAIWRDGGDGGGDINVYNNLDELKKNQFNVEDYEDQAAADEDFESALNGGNPYEDGEITQNISIEVEEVNGELVLTKPLNFHYGQ